jgi:hypothetical protein
MVALLDAPATPPHLAPSSHEAPYVYVATDLRPRQTREIELCEQASHFDWVYTGGFLLGFVGSVYLDISPLKQNSEPGIRLIGPGLVGFTWGGFMGGAYLSLPKCDPLWVEGPPPEGNVRLVWPLAAAIAVVAGVVGPFMDYTFLGPIPVEWSIAERAGRIVVGASTGVLGALFPYLLPPRTWAARRELDRIRTAGTPGGAMVTYTLRF